MRAAAVTNTVERPMSRLYVSSGLTVNNAIPVGEMEQWRRESIAKVSSISHLPVNWDAQGSNAPTRGPVQTAIEFLLNAPATDIGVPRVVPVSGGGIHFDWIYADREIEITVEPDSTFSILAIEGDIPLEDLTFTGWPHVFGWLTKG